MAVGEQQIEERAVADILGPLSQNELQNAPRVLYLRGNAGLLSEGIRVAVSGSQHPSFDGLRRARSITLQLLKHDIIAVSGLSEGVEAVVRSTALIHGGQTIGVLKMPLSRARAIGPSSVDRHLGQKHLLISQFRSNSLMNRRNVPMRNRTMALLSHATIIIEASQYSETLHLSWETLRLNRRLFLLENVVKNRAVTWPAEMLKRGAKVLGRENVEECLREMRVIARRTA